MVLSFSSHIFSLQYFLFLLFIGCVVGLFLSISLSRCLSLCVSPLHNWPRCSLSVCPHVRVCLSLSSYCLICPILSLCSAQFLSVCLSVCLYLVTAASQVMLCLCVCLFVALFYRVFVCGLFVCVYICVCFLCLSVCYYIFLCVFWLSCYLMMSFLWYFLELPYNMPLTFFSHASLFNLTQSYSTKEIIYVISLSLLSQKRSHTFDCYSHFSSNPAFIGLIGKRQSSPHFRN